VAWAMLPAAAAAFGLVAALVRRSGKRAATEPAAAPKIADAGS